MTETIAEFPGIEGGFLTGSTLVRRLTRRLLLRKLRDARIGSLRMIDGDGEVTLGEPFEGAALRAVVRIHDDRFWPKVVLGGSIGAAEAYMAGHWSADDLTAVLRFFLLNRQALDNLEDGSGRLKRPLYKVFGYLRANTRQGSRRNIQAHYDLSNEFFELFLDRRMMYSSAIFEPDTLDLDAASELKLDRLCRKLDLRPQDHLLEIGTGWGGFAVYAAETYGCRVTTTTISPAQHAKAVERVRAAGLEDRITVLLQDYRDLGGRYDKLVSIEMIEAVGLKFLDGYFQRCAELLAPGGVMAIQGITLADRNFEAYRGSVDFIQRYIFPGSSLVSVATLANSASRTDLQIVHLEDIGPHYARTLREWRLRFFERIEDVRALGFSERFERLWDYYLCYCEAGFEERVIGDVQVVLSKPSNRNRPILGDLEAATPAS